MNYVATMTIHVPFVADDEAAAKEVATEQLQEIALMLDGSLATEVTLESVKIDEEEGTSAPLKTVPVDAAALARAITLLNDHPRFGPRNRRLRFDSYSVAAELSDTLRRYGLSPTDPQLLKED